MAQRVAQTSFGALVAEGPCMSPQLHGRHAAYCWHSPELPALVMRRWLPNEPESQPRHAVREPLMLTRGSA